jgi:hypothetical protein
MAQRLPQAIQNQLDAAEAVLTKANTPPADPTAAQPTPPAITPQPAASDAPPDQQPAALQTPPAQPATDWEQKYRTLQGVMNSQMPKLQQSNKDLEAKVNELLATVEKLKTPAPAPAPAAPPVDTSKDNDEFGKDLVEMVQRQVRAYTASITARFDAFTADTATRLDKLEVGVTATTEKVAQTDEDLFFSRLTAAVPDWEAINADESFLMWLGEVDPVYRLPRQAALDRAQRGKDHAGAAAVFNAFKALKQTQQKSPAPMKQVLDGQVSPSGTQANAVPTPSAKETFTAAQVETFYRELAQKKWADRAREAKAMEDRINAALAEGRIR